MTTLVYDDLTLRAGQQPILDRIGLRVDGPGVFVLLGPSGVGKSSLLRATQRLIDHGEGCWRRQGDILLDGESIFAKGQCKRLLARRIGFIQQKPRPLRGSVIENVELALRHTTRLGRDEIRHRAEAALDQVGLLRELDNLDLDAWRLSGGQMQRLAIARAAALDPEVMLMDEPISSLDPMSSARVEDVILELGSSRLVLLVTHKVGLAVRVADTAAFLLRGPEGAFLLESGPAPEIFEDVQDPVAREFLRMGYGELSTSRAPRRDEELVVQGA